MSKDLKLLLILIGFIALFILLVYPKIVYRFNHPEKTETQLFLDFFESYREFFSK